MPESSPKGDRNVAPTPALEAAAGGRPAEGDRSYGDRAADRPSGRGAGAPHELPVRDRYDATAEAARTSTADPEEPEADTGGRGRRRRHGSPRRRS